MKEFLIKIKTGADKDLTIGSFSGLTWGESLDEEENDRKTFTFNVSSQNSDLLEYIKIGRVIRLESKTPSFKKSFVISSIGPVEGKTENEDFFEVVAEDFASFIFSRNNVGMTLDTMTDDDYIEWLDSEGLDGNAEDLVNYILVRGRLKSTDESKEGSWKVGEDSDLSDHRVNLQLSDSNTYNALIEVALLTDTIMEFDYEKKTISFYNRAENKRFDKGFQLSPYFNLADLNMTLTGEALFPILHMEGGEADTGMVVSAIPYLSYSSWERLHERLKAKFDRLTTTEREAIVEEMKSGKFFQNEYNKKVNDPNDPKGVLVGVVITEEQVKHIDSIPYLDSFLLSLDYYDKNLIEEGDKDFQSFLEMIYLDLGVANSNLQSKNIRNMLIEEQVLRTERRINEAADVVAASREDIYEDESNKLDSLFMKKGGRQSEEENYIKWISGDTIIPGTDGKQFRDFYTGRYVFQEIDYDEYQYLKAMEEEGEKVYEDWDERNPLLGKINPLTGEPENPNLLYRTGTRYFFTNSVEELRGLKINIVEKHKDGRTEDYNVEFSDSSDENKNMESKTLRRVYDEIDNSKWENWDVDGYRQYSEKRHTVEIVDDLKKNFEDWEDFFNDKAGDEERFKIESEGRLRYPELKAVNSSLKSNTKPVLKSDWEFTFDSVDGYTKIIETEDGFYRNLSGTELYSGSTNPNMSYPVRKEFFRGFDEKAQFYPFNDNMTLVIEQGKRVGYLRKDSPMVFRQILGAFETYRVFFYSDSIFTLSWGNENSSTIGLFIVDDERINISGSTVEVDLPIGVVTGGWYREKELLDENMIIKTERDVLGSINPFLEEEYDIVIDHLGYEWVDRTPFFSIDLLKKEIRDNLAHNRSSWRDDFQEVLDNTTVGSKYVIIGTASLAALWYHYKVTITFTLGPKQKGFYFVNKETKKIEASTWDDLETELRTWQFDNVRLLGYGAPKDLEGYDQIITHEDSYLFITADPIEESLGEYDYIWSGWSAKGSEPASTRKTILSQEKLYLLQAYDSNTSDTGNIYFLGKDINNKARITRVTGEFNETIINYYGENMIWRGGNRFLKISSRGNIWVGTYQTVTGFESEDAETEIEFPKILEMQPRVENNEKKWDYLPFRNTIFYKGKLGTSWRIEEGHTINLGKRIIQDEVEAQVSDGKIPLNAISYHLEKPSTTYSARQIGWGVRSTFSTIPSSELSFTFKVTEAQIQYTKDSFDMLRFETPYLDLLNVFRGQDYIRDLNYKYRREIDFYINERKEIEEKMGGTEEEKEFYKSELEAIESEIGDVNGYILPDKLEGLGDFWKYRTLREYQNETGVDSIPKWKNYSAWLTDPDSDSTDWIMFEGKPSRTDLLVIEFRAVDPFEINGQPIYPSGFWEKRIFVSEEEFVKISGENIQIRLIKVVDPKDEKFIKALKDLITWENEYIYEEDDPVAMTEPNTTTGVTINHMRVFLNQPEKYTGAFKEGEEGEEGLGYSTIKGRLTLKQNRFEHFMWDRESRATKASPITYENSTHGELKKAREEREKIWFRLKQDYPEFLLEGYYTNETENDAYNLLQQAKASYKYHNKPSEEYSITYIEAQDLVGDANDVRVGDKVAIKSRMRDQLGLSDRLQVTAISRELRDPGNIQIEVSPIRRDNLLEKVFGLVKRK